MKLLLLGGTRFLGRHVAALALEQGHQVSLLHRGRSASNLFSQAEHLLADRDQDLSLLAGRHWDAVIDTSAYVPRQVHQVATALAGRVGHYQLVSSISVYAQFAPDGTAEDAPLTVLEDPTTEVVTGATYGGLKALCEAQARHGFAGRCLVTRPGLIVGPHDPTGRFTWWVQRFQRGGEVLAPGDPQAPVQFIDARDAAAWMLKQAQDQTAGTFNLTGPAQALTMAEMLSTLRATLQPSAQVHWVDETFLLNYPVRPWTELPVWLPQDKAGLHRAHIGAALAKGLVCRALATTVLDTAAWVNESGAAPAVLIPPSPGAAAPEVGLEGKKEAALMAAWFASNQASQGG